MLGRRTVYGIMLFLLLIGIFSLTVNIKPAKSTWTGTVYIRADGSIDPPTAPIRRDGSLYTFTDDIYGSIVVERDNILIDGAGYILQGSGRGKGINLSERTNVTIRNIQINYFEDGIYACSSSWVCISGNNITANNVASVYFEKSSKISISGNTIKDGIYGVDLFYSSSSNISGNNIKNNRYGIYLEYSSENSICGNNVEAGESGVRLLYSSNNNISRNNIINSLSGILLYDSIKNNISGNNIKNNRWGIDLEYSSVRNCISENNITESGAYGIYLSSASSYNIISENNIKNNRYGVCPTSSDNRFYYNNFIDNTWQVYKTGSINIWDNGYPSGGNYWSDYINKYPNARELLMALVCGIPHML